MTRSAERSAELASVRILVSGANGHLGSRLLRRLARDPAAPRVRALVRSERAAATLRAHSGEAQLEVTVVDYADANGMARAADGCQHVVHLVGILKESTGTSYEDAHERATAVLLRAAVKAGVRSVVYPSILGARPDAANECLASKGRAERLLLDGPLPATVLRLPMVLGPGELAARALLARVRARAVALVRGGASLEQPIDAEDVVSAVLAALGARAARALDLAGPESLSQRALLARAAALLGLPAPRVIPLPRALAFLAAAAAERLLASPPVTRAMLGVLDHDDCIDPQPACAELGIALTPLDVSLRRCLSGGRGDRE